MNTNKHNLHFFSWLFERLVFYLKARKFPCFPWRYNFLLIFLKAFPENPIRAIIYFRKLIRKEIPCEGFILLVCGPKVLRDGLNVCKKLKLKPFLIWGTLLGFAREAGFIKHDPDIDIGLLKRDFIRKNQLKQAMITKGYKFIYEDEYELLFTHRKFQSLNIDFALFYEKNEQMACSMYDGTQNYSVVYTYYFPLDVFADFKKVTFENNKVLVPLQTEKFLSVSYGDWRVPKKNWDHLHDYLNLRIEEKMVEKE